ncbi:MAG TPA: DUF2243 domain-containing protein [Burkholderiales bacterium]|nr:DUF2243 domain-containing protein [Burkholderiales bacterium]
MRTTRARQAALLLGLGLGGFFEGILLHPLGGFVYMALWALTLGGVLLLWTAMRGPGALPSGRAFVANFVIGWGVFNMLEALARHDLRHEWLVFATGMGFALLGAILLWTRPEPHFIERRTGDDRRSGSPVR